MPSKATHCKRGHVFDMLNTYYTPSGNRVCRACRRMAESKAGKQAKENKANVSKA